MIKRLFFLLLFPNFLFAQNLVNYVNPFVGTGGHGHTFPGATAPFGFCQLSPDTRIDGSWDGCGGYHYSDSVIYGFSHTHLSGTGVSDYGDILLMPVTQKMRLDNYDYKSTFLHKSEKAEPGYYRVFLEQHRIGVELTTSRRCGFHQYTYAPNAETYVVLDLAHRDELLKSKMEMVDKHTIRGYRFSKAWATNQKIFFEIKFEQEIERILYAPLKMSSKTHAISLQKSPRALIKLKRRSSKSANPSAYQIVRAKVGISGVDMDGARNNLRTEIPHWNFNKTKKWVQDEWNKELAKIQVSHKEEKLHTAKYALPNLKKLPAYKRDRHDEMVIFYTALYHCMIAPNIYSDVDNRYRGRDDKIHSTQGLFDYYTVFSLWDTYRALHPLLTIIDKKRTNDFINTFIKQYEQGGRLPVWELSSNETNCMIGYHAVSVIWDAYNKGIRNYDAEKAFEAMKSIATEDSEALRSYMRYGYIRAEDDHESVSKTLEYAYNDWCIAQMAKSLGKEEDYKTFERRSHNWINVYDPTTGFMRARKNSTLMEPFSPYLVDNNYTEANSWQYSFYVPHDPYAFTMCHGGTAGLERLLDSLFLAHERTEGRVQSDITGLIGQYAHGNEPSHHIPYLYHCIGKKEKGERFIERVLNDFYLNAPNGYIGNEDCGQMSAWYVLNQTGIYSFVPGSNYYIARSKEKFKFSDEFVQRRKDTVLDFHLYEDIKLGKLRAFNVRMRCMDTMALGISKEKVPNFSFASLSVSAAPFVLPRTRNFSTSFKLKLGVANDPFLKSKKIYYKFKGSDRYKLFAEPLEIASTQEISFFSVGRNEQPELICVIPDPEYDGEFVLPEFKQFDTSYVQTAIFTKLPDDKEVFLNATYGKTYHAGGPMGLVDGIYGKKNWRAGDWQGYQGQDFEAVVKYTGIEEVRTIKANFLQDQRAWIFYPTEVSFYESADSLSWNLIETVSLDNLKGRDEDHVTIRKVSCSEALNGSTNGHYYKVIAKNYGALPDWHPGRGHPAYIFIDEIEIE